MTNIAGLSDEDLEAHVINFEELISKGLDETMRQVLNRMDNIVAAADDPTRGKSTSTKPITLAAMSYISYYWNKFVREEAIGWLEDFFATSSYAILQSVHAIWSRFTGTPINAKKHTASKRYIATASRRLEFIGVELLDHARDELQEGLRLDETVPQLTQRLMGAADLTRKKAESIARTEAVSANNMASLIQVQELGGIGTKTWLSKIDDRTRETHRHADDQTVRISQQFHVGLSRLAFPGDPSGPPSEVFNCRCTLTYDIDYFELENSTLKIKG